MRTIKELLLKDKVVRFYLDNGEMCKAFYRQAHEEGFSFGNLPYEEWVTGYAVAVRDDGRMGHVPMFVWTMSFDENGWRGINGSRPPIDYRRYISGEEDYICRSSHFKAAGIDSPAAENKR